ncbi:MAG: SAM-dependent methyltransferase [Bacillota bacterium]|nr:SAM-dependent methyltransferase [Bacillota bacterium]
MSDKRPGPGDYRESVVAAILEDPGFIRATFAGAGSTQQWKKLSIRPVTIRGDHHLQFVYFDGKKALTENHVIEPSRAKILEALSYGFANVHVQGSAGDLHVRITRKGRALAKHAKPSRPGEEPLLDHNLPKKYMLDVSRPDEFLAATGIMSADGRIKLTMQRKFHQVNEFLRVIEQVLPVLVDAAEGAAGSAGDSAAVCSEGATGTAQRPLRIVDCGSGTAHLTFAIYHYLHNVRGFAAEIIGIDTNPDVIESSRNLRDSLGWPQPQFANSRILDFDPKAPPDMVLSLHACDLATDEAIAKGILWRSRVILAAPCCQHELHRKLDAPGMRAVLRHGLLRERLADIVTDAIRALVLRIMGYRTHVIEFVSPDSTTKNLMIRAELGLALGDSVFVQEYRDLCGFLHIKPAIETMLGESFGKHLAR